MIHEVLEGLESLFPQIPVDYLLLKLQHLLQLLHITSVYLTKS